MVIPFIFLSDQGKVKFFVDSLNWNVKTINLFCHSITVCDSICRRLEKFCAVFLCVLCCSYKQIYDVFGNQAYMKCHLAVFDCQSSLAIIGLVYMEHSAVCIKLCGVGAVFQNGILGIVLLFFRICFGIIFFGICGRCRNCLGFCQNRSKTSKHKCSA